MKIGKVLGTEVSHTYQPNDWPLPYTLIGVEVEAERITGRPEGLNQSFWATKSEGSLRDNGREFVFNSPLFGNDAENALRNLESALDGMGDHPRYRGRDAPRYSHRTSVHIHLDIRDMEPFQLFTLIQNYIIFEPMLFNWIYQNTGVDRTESPFCVPYYQFPQSYYAAFHELIRQTYFEDERQYFDYLSRSLEYLSHGVGFKYSALNFNTIFNIGTVEFRQMAGTHNFNLLDRWIRILLYLKRFSMNNTSDPETTLMNISAQGPEQYIRQVFNDMAEELYYPEMRQDIYRGIRRSQHMIYMDQLHQVNRQIHQDRLEGQDDNILNHIQAGLKKRNRS